MAKAAPPLTQYVGLARDAYSSLIKSSKAIVCFDDDFIRVCRMAVVLSKTLLAEAGEKSKHYN